MFSGSGLTLFAALERFNAQVSQTGTDMKRIVCLTIALGLATAAKTQALGSLADVSIVDRDSGAVLCPHYYRGEYWVAGRPGARYAIEIHNRLGERVLAVTAVDGVNVVSGATAAWAQTGYVFGPGENYQITGWRKTDAQIAGFTFTDSSISYAERTGRPANVGVIGVALFRERPALEVPAYAPQVSEDAARSPPASATMERAQSASDSAALGKAEHSTGGGADADRRVANAMPAPAPRLGTGHGAREYSYVTHTDFERMQPQPNEVIRIRYDSMDNLVAMGVLRRPRPTAPGIDAFPGSAQAQYVPDPRG